MTTTSASSDPALAGPPVTSVDQAIARMEAIAAALPVDDGLSRFNSLYLTTTIEVKARLGAGFFTDPTFMAALDVAFANLYLDAVRASVSRPGGVPRCWDALLERRSARRVAPVQFALAGMNAHINRDLPVAVVATCRALGVSPDDDPHRADYDRINAVLAEIEHGIRHHFLDDPPPPFCEPRALHLLEQVLANWSFDAARDAAWSNAEALWALRHTGWLADRYLRGLDRLVGFAGRGLLVALP